MNEPAWYNELIRLCDEITHLRKIGAWTRHDYDRILARAKVIVGEDTFALNAIYQQGMFLPR